MLTECIECHIDVMRDKSISSHTFRQELFWLTRDLLRTIPNYKSLDSDNTVIVPVLRAGLGMLAGVQGLLPKANVGFIDISRDERSPTLYHTMLSCKLPAIKGKTIIIIDPMLATGGSIILASQHLRKFNPSRIIVLCAIAAPEGLNAVTVADPDIEVIPAAVDEGLDNKAYIVPGLGDAGDRLYGEAI